MRKSPYRHHVRAHRRSGRPVHDYERGHGAKPVRRLAKPTIGRHNKSSSVSNYTVHIRYSRSPSETISVTASSYPQAIDTAMISRFQFEPPLEIDIKRC